MQSTKSFVFASSSLALWIATIYLFSIIAPWTTAKEPQSIPIEDMRLEAMNAKWVATVHEHGKWLNWERGTVAQSPVYFFVHLIGLIICAGTASMLAFLANKSYKANNGMHTTV